CEIPYDILDDLSGKMPKLRQQIMRLMSHEIMGDQEMILLLSKKNAEERLAAFLYNLSTRFAERGFSAREFRLSMTRGDIGNYLGLTVETISRLLGRFQKLELIKVKGKYVTILNNQSLAELAGMPSCPAC
ncbi:MAG: fumarate/nitrate reduction transcriptional regulator Fnr, partial [Aeromonadaceae bacterium]